jgi:soluble lytic murein transglycosylase-like protein
MDGIGNIAAQRIYDALQGVQTRLQEIESRTGLSFSDYLARTQTMSASETGGTAVGDSVAEAAYAANEAAGTPAALNNSVGTALPETAYSAGLPDPVTALQNVFASLPASEYDSLFLEAADRYGLNPSLIKAVAFAESGFRGTAVSGAGAMGLMQLMPYTAEALGVSDPFDPEQNVDGGARLLSSLLDQFGGDSLMAVAAYNAGAAGVTSRGITDLTDSLQRSLLPAETRGYLNNLESYLSSAGVLSVLDNPFGG